MTIIAQVPVVDYVTMTTFETDKFVELRECVLMSGHEMTNESKRGAYGGYTIGPYWFGEGRQKGIPHYIVQVSGGEAHYALPGMSPFDMRVKRVDVQVTLDAGDLSDIEKELKEMGEYRETDTPITYLRHMYEMQKWSRGRTKKLDVITDGGMDTLYIGGRRRTRLFTRVYIKELADGLNGIRYEVELKGEAAQAFIEKYRQGDQLKSLCARVIVDECSKLPGACPLRKRVLETANRALHGDVTGLTYDTINKDAHRTLKWLRNTVTPAVHRLLNDHDAKRDVTTWVLAMVELAEIAPPESGHIDDRSEKNETFK